MENCTSLALKVKGSIDPSYSIYEKQGLIQTIVNLGKCHRRKIRVLDDENSPLESGEWMILFLGFWEYREKSFGCDYLSHDYHFVLRQVDGSWIQRDLGGPIVPANIEELIADAQKEGIEYKFFAVSET